MKVSAAIPMLFFVVAAGLQAERLGQDFQVRLTTPIASFSPVGTPFKAKVLGTLAPPEKWALPAGSVVKGVVRRANPIGLGIKRERSLLELEFDGCELPSGEAVECSIKLVAVDNAREAVKSNNRIEGILAAAHPHSWLQGVWYRPTSGFLKRSSVGLTGAGGMVQSRFLPTPTGAALVIGSRLILMRLPDPEIVLPAGTDLILHISVTSTELIQNEPMPDKPSLSSEFAQWLNERPPDIRHSNRSAAADLINVVLVGGKDELLNSFEVAGWTQAEPLNAKTFARTYSAYSSMKTYPSAPVSSLYYQGRLPDLVFERSYNSLAMRHHIRFWEVDSPEGAIWLGAATHDIAIELDWKRMALSHRIDMRIDRERSTVMNDLTEAQCLRDRELIGRPELSNQLLNRAVTDGALVIGTLQNCVYATPLSPVLERPRAAMPVRLARRTILETRQYFTRGNAYYQMYQAIRWAFPSSPEPEVED